MKKDSKNSGLKKKTSKKTSTKAKEAKKKAVAAKPSKKPIVKNKKEKAKTSPKVKGSVIQSKRPIKKVVAKTTKAAKPVTKQATAKKVLKNGVIPEKPKAKVSTLKKPTLKVKDTKKPGKKISAPVKPLKKAKIAEKPEKISRVKEVAKIIEVGKEKLKHAGKKVVEKVAEILKPEKVKVQPKPKIVSEEPEPDFAELEHLEIAEVIVKEKPKRPKSRKSLLKNKQQENAPEIRRMPLPDLSAINYNNFKKSEKPEPAKIEAQPSVLIKTEVKKADPRKAEIKNRIFEKCLILQTDSVNIAKRAMNDAQESANEEKGSMEEKFDSFRESMHITRDMYARQFQEGMNSLSMLKRINPNLEHNTVILGSVVYTEFQNYFVSVSLGEIAVDEDKFITISTSTPLFQALSGKSKGDKFKFRDKVYTIKDVF